MTLLTENRPGLFKAYCKGPLWVLFEQLLEANPDTTTSRWDPKLRCTVFLVQCDFETEDRAAYVAHARTVHGRVMSSGCNAPWAFKRWHGPRLEQDGKPFKPSTKAIGEDLQTCLRCGLVAQVGDRAVDQLWWAEHERMCAKSVEAPK